MAAKTEKANYALKRLLSFFKIFLKNKRGLLGVILILFFVFMAILAPLLTPYQPLQEFLSGNYAAPVWMKYLPTILGGDPTLSENLQAINDTTFSQGISGWALTKDSAHIGDLQLVSGFGRYDDNHSMALTFTRDETGNDSVLAGACNASIYYDFYYPYQGGPYKFIGNEGIFVNGTHSFGVALILTQNFSSGAWYYEPTVIHPLFVVPQIHVFLERLSDGEKFDVYPIPYTNTNDTVWALNGNFTQASINTTTDWWDAATNSENLYDQPGNAPGVFLHSQSAVDVVRQAFNGSGYYRWGLDISFLDVLNSTVPVQTTIYVDRESFFCYGNSWGLLGADNHGRDLWSQLVYGSRISLIVGLLAGSIGVGLGLAVGLAAGFLGSAADEVLMRFTDLLLVIPFLPLMMVLVEILGPGIENLIIIIGFLSWMGFARVIRSQVLTLKERPFIEAARSVGAGRTHIIVRHIMPNVMALVYVTLATSVPGAITLEASLAFLGFYDPMRMSWGRMLNGAFQLSGSLSWWWVVVPGLCIALLAMAFILLGFALDEVLNPRLRLRR